MIDRVGYKDEECALLTLNQYLKQRPINVTPIIHNIRTIQKDLGSLRAQ